MKNLFIKKLALLSVALSWGTLAFSSSSSLQDEDVSQDQGGTIVSLQQESNENTLEAFKINPYSSSPEEFNRFVGSLPLENRGNTLENFETETDDQKVALKCVEILLNQVPQDTGIGLWLFGDPGLGKTHLAVGLGRKFSEKDKKVLFLQKLDSFDETYLYKSDVFILNDLDNAKDSKNTFNKILLHTFDQGKIVCITSDSDFYKDFKKSNKKKNSKKEKQYSKKEKKYSKLYDRTENMIITLDLEGDSYRSKQSWISEALESASSNNK